MLSFTLLLSLLYVGVSANTVDGYNVSTTFWIDDPSDSLDFTDTVISPINSDYIYVHVLVNFNEVVKKNVIFDFSMDLDIDVCSSIQLDYVYLGYVGESKVEYVDGTITNNIFSLSGVSGSNDIDRIGILFLINKPIWEKYEQIITDTCYIDDKEFVFEKNKTWTYICDSDYNNIGLYIDEGKVYCDVGTETYKLMYNDSIVSSSDSVVSGGYYTLEPLETVATTIYFYYNQDPFTCESGMTWEDYISSTYNPTLGNGAKRFFIMGTIVYEYNYFTVYYYDDSLDPYDPYSYVQVQPTDIIEHGNYYVPSYNVPTEEEEEEEDYSLFGLISYKYKFVISSISFLEANEQGLLGLIIAHIKNIPSEIGKKIQGLFVPDNDTILELKDKFIKLLADRFGFAYESIEVTDNIISAFTYKEIKSIIEVPKVTVNLAGSDFTFGGWEVRVIPEGFEEIANTCKLIINVVLTGVFVNGARKRMFEVIGDAR